MGKTKKEIKEYIERLTMKEFPNLTKLTLSEINNIKQIVIEAEALWNVGVEDSIVVSVGCGAICRHGHNELTCSKCREERG